MTNNQVELLPLLTGFSRNFYLAGDTVVALHVGHRQSIDFDLFTDSELNIKGVKNKLAQSGYRFKVLHEAYDQYHILISDVKITFFNFPFGIPHEIRLEKIITMPDLITLSAMKAFTLGGRAKWKDYVDLFFLLRHHFSIFDIADRARELFQDAFNLKLFRQQLAYYEDIDYSEAVSFVGEDPDDIEITDFLTKIATEKF